MVKMVNPVNSGGSPRTVPRIVYVNAWLYRLRNNAPKYLRLLTLVLIFVLFAPVQAAGRQNVDVVWSNDAPLGGYQFGDFDGDGKTDLFRISGNQWQYSSAGTGPWTNLATDATPQVELRFGDFDGDGKTDVFRVSGNQWQTSRSGLEAWADLATDSAPVTDLRFGDFDGDGKTDIFSINSGTGQWRYSSGGTGAYMNLATESLTVSDLQFGFFDGDDKIDVFNRRADGQWRFSSGGVAGWEDLASDPSVELALGDFDGDGITDVFNRESSGQWRYSRSGRDPWTSLANEPGVAFADLRYGDFNGDNRTDLFSLGTSNQPRYASGGTSAWQNLTPAAPPTPVPLDPPTTAIANLAFGDFDADGYTDVFRIENGQWQYSSRGLGEWQNLASDPLPLSDLRLLDINGDARTDIFSVDPNGRWRWSDGGRSNWQELAMDNLPVTELRSGDFDGDGKADIFSRENSGQWRFRSGGLGDWILLATDPLPLSELDFGDFNGDGKTDVFSIDPVTGRGRYSDAARAPWVPLDVEGIPLNQLRFGDFDGDGRTDIFTRDANGQWRYLRAGQGNWVNVASDPLPLSDLRFGDFNGDDRTDVFSIGPDGRWRYSSAAESEWILLGPPVAVTVSPTLTTTPTAYPSQQPTGQPTGSSCPDILTNGDFETNANWSFGNSPVPGKYTGAQKKNGLRSVQLGIPAESAQVESYSSMSQWVTIPPNASTLTLRWWQWGHSEEGQNPNPSTYEDRLDVILLSPGGDTLKVLHRVRHNDNGWQPLSLDLTEFIGQSFSVYFNLYNDGRGGRSLIYLDSVALEVCGGGGGGPMQGQPMPGANTGMGGPQMGNPNMGNPNMQRPHGPEKSWQPEAETPTSTYTPTPTWTPTLSPTPTWTPTATATMTETNGLTETNEITNTEEVTVSVAPLNIPISTPDPTPALVDECRELVDNGDFEAANRGWTVLESPAAPIYTTELNINRSQQSMRLGLVEGENQASISAIDQVIALPGDANSIILSFRYYPLHEPMPGPGDLQYVDIYNMLTGQFAGRALGVQSDDRLWLAEDYDLTMQAGQTIRLVIAVNNDGQGGRTAMYVDNVSIMACNFANLAAPNSERNIQPGISSRPVADQSPIVLEGRETGGPPAWLARLTAVGVMASVAGVIGFAAMVIAETLRRRD
jgi:hypothetical protein